MNISLKKISLLCCFMVPQIGLCADGLFQSEDPKKLIIRVPVSITRYAPSQQIFVTCKLDIPDQSYGIFGQTSIYSDASGAYEGIADVYIVYYPSSVEKIAINNRYECSMKPNSSLSKVDMDNYIPDPSMPKTLKVSGKVVNGTGLGLIK